LFWWVPQVLGARLVAVDCLLGQCNLFLEI
jgi:hypothetical protein